MQLILCVVSRDIKSCPSFSDTALSAKLAKGVTNECVAIFKGVILFSVYSMYISVTGHCLEETLWD